MACPVGLMVPLALSSIFRIIFRGIPAMSKTPVRRGSKSSRVFSPAGPKTASSRAMEPPGERCLPGRSQNPVGSGPGCRRLPSHEFSMEELAAPGRWCSRGWRFEPPPPPPLPSPLCPRASVQLCVARGARSSAAPFRFRMMLLLSKPRKVRGSCVNIQGCSGEPTR